MSRYDETNGTPPEYLEQVMREIRVPAGYRYVHPVSCVAGPYLRGTGNGTQWQRLWPRVDRRVDSRCSSSELPTVERTRWFPCTD